jgi:hypothetical protein
LINIYLKLFHSSRIGSDKNLGITTTKEGLSCSDYIQQIWSTTDELSFIRALSPMMTSCDTYMRDSTLEFNLIVVTANARSEPFSFTDLISLILFHESLVQSQLSALSLSATNNLTGFYLNLQRIKKNNKIIITRPDPTN